MIKLTPISTMNYKATLSLLALMFSFQAIAFNDTICGSIAGFEFSNGSTSVVINNDQSYYIGDLPSNFYVDLLVSGFSESASFEVKNVNTGQTYAVGENILPYTFPGGNGAWNFGFGNFEVKAKIFEFNNCQGSYCDSKTIKFKILSSPPCGNIGGFQFSNGTDAVSIIDNDIYDLASLPSNFYLDLLVNGFSESASFKLKNVDTGVEYTVGENTLPYTVPGGNAAWSYGEGTFELQAKIFEFNNCQGSYCDSKTIKFTIVDQIIPNCACDGGLTAVTFTYSGTGQLATNSGIITDNGDGTYTITNGGLKILKDLQVSDGSQVANIHTSCSQDLLGVNFTSDLEVIGYVDSQGGSASIDGGCIAAPVCGSVTGFVFTDGVTSMPITNDQTYALSDLPANFYVQAVVNGYAASAKFLIENKDTGIHYTGIDNTAAFSYPENAGWDLGNAQFELKGEIYKFENASGSKCDYTTVKFTLVDQIIPNCACDGGLTAVTFTYSGTGQLATNSGIITDNGDGTYTITNGGLKILKDLQVSDGSQVANIHTSCSQNLLGVNFTSDIEVIGYVDSQGGSASIDGGCVAAPVCGTVTGFVFTDGVTAIPITNDQTYALTDLPANFYVQIVVDGFAESANFIIKNKDTDVEYTAVDNTAPYTYPENVGWDLGNAEFELKGEIYKFDNANGSKCDYTTIKFTLVDQIIPDCACEGGLSSLTFNYSGTNPLTTNSGVITDNGDGTYTITNGGEKILKDLQISGSSQVANIHTSCSQNLLGIDFGGGIVVIGYTDTQGNSGSLDGGCVAAPVCGNVTGFVFTDGITSIPITNDNTYATVSLPANFYVQAVVDGFPESAKFIIKNKDTDVEYIGLDNTAPFSYPENAGWDLGHAEFELKGEIYKMDNANGSKCDYLTVKFTLVDCLANVGTTVVDSNVFIWTPALNPVVTIIPGNDAVLPVGYNYAILISKTNNTIRFWSNALSIALEEPGNFNVHLLAYDPNTLDLTSIVLGITTITDLQNTIANNGLCASLDSSGASITVINGGSDEKVASDPVKGDIKDEVVLTVKTEELPSTDNTVAIKLYPNPVVNNLNIEVLLLDAEVINYSMMDLNGKQLLSGSLDNSTYGKTKVNTSKLANGLYIITFESNFRSFSKKVQVNH